MIMALHPCLPWAGDPTCGHGDPGTAVLATALSPGASAPFHLFWVVIFIAVIMNNRAIAKLPTSSKRCMDALSYVSMAYILGQGRIFVLLGASSYWGAIICLAITLPLVLYGIILAIVGLTEYRHLAYERGKKHAIWALVLGGCYFFLIAIGIGMGMSKKHRQPLDMIAESRRDEAVNHDHNYRMKIPPGWIEMDSKMLNPDASFAMGKKKHKAYFIIISEKSGFHDPWTNDRVIEFTKANLAANAKNVEFLLLEPMVIGHTEGMHLKARAEVASQEIFYNCWGHSRGGFVYQLMLFHDNAVDFSKEEARDVFSMFSVLDDEAYAVVDGSEPFAMHEAPSLGFSVRLDPQQWVAPGEELADVDTGAEVQAIHVDTMSKLSIAAYVDREAMPSMDELAYSLVRKCVTGHFPECTLTNDLVAEEGDFTVRSFTLFYDSDQEQKECRIKLYRRQDRGYLVSLEGAKGSESLDALQAAALGGIRLGELIPGEADLDHGQKIRQAMLYNQVGLYFHAREDYATSLGYFRKAHAWALDNRDYVFNSLSSYGRLDQYDGGIEFIASLAAPWREDTDILLWHAWLLLQKGLAEDAMAIYRPIFAGGHRSDEDIKYFMQALAQAGRWDELASTCERYGMLDASSAIPMERARLLREHGRSREAIAILAPLASAAPDDEAAAIALIKAHADLGEHKISLERCAGHLAAGRRNPAFFYLKADAEIALKWYREARHTLEQGLLISPGDDELRRSLQFVVGLLGEGERTGVVEGIDEVALPPELASLRPGWDRSMAKDDAGAFNSRFLDKLCAIFFMPGKDYRITHRYRVQVLNAGGVADHSTISVDFDPLCQRVCVHEILVRSDDGKVVAKTRPEDYYVIDKQNNSYADHTKTLYVPVPKLNVGNIVDVCYTLCYYDAPHRFNLYEDCLAEGRPVMLYAVSYQGDKAAVRTDSRRIDRELALGHDVLAWVVESPEVLWDEPYRDRWSETGPCLWIAESGSDWRSCGEEYLGLIAGKVGAGKALRHVVDDLVGQCDTKEMALSAIVRHVQTKYTYRPIEFGIRAYLPNPSATTLHNQYGDCKDLSVLLLDMLNAAGIDAGLALVNSDGDINTNLPTLDQFNHMIVHVPGMAGGLFIDPTEQDMDFRSSPPFGLADRKALILKHGESRLVRLPPYAQGASQVTVERVYEQGPGKTFVANESIHCRGLIAASMRNYLKAASPEERDDWIQQLLNGGARQPEIRGLTYHNIDDPEQPLIINLSYEAMAGSIDVDGREIVSVPNQWEKYFIQFERVKERRSAFRLTAPFVFHGKTTLKPGMGLSVGMISSPGAGKSRFCEWETKVSEGGEMGLEFRFERGSGTYPREDYNAFCDECEHAVMSAQVKVDLDRKATMGPQ